jgi:hypothetical protein
MWDITIYLMRLVDYLQGCKDEKTCRICNFIAKNEIELERHMKKEHETY